MTRKGAKRKRTTEKQPNRTKKARSKTSVPEKIQTLDVIKQKEASECCICLDTQGSGIMKFLICGHKFHEFCIDKWFVITPVDIVRCPLCRTDQMWESLDLPNSPISAIHNK
ncbi:hypothetical protein NPIL_240911 [Nephila pilipes]|uniref:RING-type domain-containing protein n=1 Tax=Nephila pilipes TaxID=299642 RepID=A0A8X6MWP1_NEPPI|nr:hypothetical protein NPIL_240911 [Nephila pilipes]